MIEIRPQAGPQETFLASSADVAIYGGAAGGGKTWALLMEPLRHIHNPAFGAVIFRRTFPQVTREGGMWDQSEEIYPALGARSVRGDLYWEFPSKARISFAHMQHEDTKLDWQGAQIPLIEFDELTHFTESQFFYMFSRNRSTCGVTPYIRAGCNPDSESWVANLIAWWIDQETGVAIPERSGVLRWFARVGDDLQWADNPETLRAKWPDVAPKSLTFVPARVYDNPALLNKDPGYLANLMALPYVERERLLGANWKVRPAAGKIFNRAWFELVPVVPEGGIECRFWDFAATRKELAKDDPDYTAGVKIRAVDGAWYVTDAIAEQIGPAEVERLFMTTSQRDAAQAIGNKARYMVRWEVEPGSAGKREAQRLTRLLAGLDASGVPSRGDKLARARPLAAQAEAGNVKLLRAPWNEPFLGELHHQPDAAHDDRMDAAAGAFTAVTQTARMARSYQG